MNEDSKASVQTEDQITAPAEKRNPAFHLFLYLVAFISLAFVVAGINNVYFQLINKFIQEPEGVRVYSAMFDSGALKFAISSLIVAAPIYLGVFSMINRKLIKEEIEAASFVRKVITYLALVAFSAMSLGSIVSIIYNYLDGELTQKFFLKTLVFFIVSGYFFSFYFWEIRRKVFDLKQFRMFFSLAVLLVLSALIVGFAIVDSPQVTREKRQDQQLLERLSTFRYDINNFYEQKKQLPDIEKKELVLPQGIIYKKLSESDYQLCANFKHDSGASRFEGELTYKAGEYCFTFNVFQTNQKEAF
jgi:hypothetical protein